MHDPEPPRKQYMVIFSNGTRMRVSAYSVEGARTAARNAYYAEHHKRGGSIDSAHEIGSAFHPGSSMGPGR